MRYPIPDTYGVSQSIGPTRWGAGEGRPRESDSLIYMAHLTDFILTRGPFMRLLLSDLREYGLRTAIWNARFQLGYKIGGFTHATRDYRP